MSHLSTYEGKTYSGILGLRSSTAKTVTLVNYNYYCVEKLPELIADQYIEDYYSLVLGLFNEFYEPVTKYVALWKDGQILSKQLPYNKPILFVEGELDIKYIKRAAEHLKQESTLKAIEMRQRGGNTNLNKLWTTLKEVNWETVPQRKMLLYDCDTNQSNDDFGILYKRVIPHQTNNPVKKGIENLFPFDTINKAMSFNPRFIDVAHTKGSHRGDAYELTVYEINVNEKKNLCEWLCNTGEKEDFKHFEHIFKFIAVLTEK